MAPSGQVDLRPRDRGPADAGTYYALWSADTLAFDGDGLRAAPRGLHDQPRTRGGTPPVDQLWQHLYGRGVLTGHVASSAQRWHFILDSGETVSLLINDDEEPRAVLARFDEALACRLAAELEMGVARRAWG